MRDIIRFWLCAVAMTAIGCTGGPETALGRLVEARQLSADLLVQFTKAADASNLAVMADTDEASTAFARDAELVSGAVQKDSDALGPALTDLGYADEVRLLGEFNAAFAAYREVDRTILGLAVENTNLKAQRLSFGAAQEAADAFRKALEAMKPLTERDTWHVAALGATAVASVREIQVLQAPHIPEADDARMAALEKGMATSEATARSTLATLRTLVTAASQPQLAAATAALDRFMGVNAEIVTLSRRNSNVRSLALSLGEKRMLAAKCEESLSALQKGLSARQIGGTR